MRSTILNIGIAALLAAGAAAAADDTSLSSGRGLFVRNCAPCHGDSGRGDGANAVLFLSKPRNLREGFLEKHPTGALVQRILDGKRLSLGVDPQASKRHAQQVDAIEKHLLTFAWRDPQAVEYGWAIYAQRCAACHGPFGEPSDSLPAGVKKPRTLSSRVFQASVTDEQLAEAARHGRRGMPALIPRLPADAASSVTTFIRTLTPGFELYSMYCGHCHGDDGVGIGNYDETVGAPTVVFDAAYFAKVDPTELRESIWHMLRAEKPSMPHFRARLSEANVRLIVEYLKGLPPEKAAKTEAR